MSASLRRPYLDGLRGAASFMVLLNHLALSVIPSISTLKLDQFNSQFLIDIGRSPLGAIWSGDFGVCIFFVLSGFVLAQFAQESELSFPSMLVRRYARLALPMVASTLLAYLLLKAGLFANAQAANQISHSYWFGLWYQFAPSLSAAIWDGVARAFVTGHSDYNSNLWTMQIELVGSAAIFALYSIPAGILPRLGALGMGIVLLPGYYPLFAIGSALYELHRLTEHCGLQRAKAAVECGALVLFGAGVLAGAFPASGTHTGIVSTWHSWLSNSDNAQAWHMAGASLLMIAVLRSRLLQRVLASRGGRYLGRLSFPIYLVQIPLLCSVTAHIMLGMSEYPYPIIAAVTVIATLLTAIVAAHLMSVGVEFPTLRLSRMAGSLVERFIQRLRVADRLENVANEQFEKGAFGGVGRYLTFAAIVRPLRPDSSVRLAIVNLVKGRESRAIKNLKAAASADPFFWNSDLDIPRRPAVDNPARPADTAFGELGLLAAGYNFAAMRAFQVGRGHLSTDLAAKAVQLQPRLRKIASPASAVMNFLHQHELRLDDAWIMPFNWVTQIGHQGMLDLMFRMRELGWWKGSAILLAPPDRVANRLFQSMVTDRPGVFTVDGASDSPLMLEFEALLRSHGLFYHVFQPPNSPFVRWHEAASLALFREPVIETQHLASTFDNLLISNAELQHAFDAAMADWGIGPDDWYVCLHLRELGHHTTEVDTGQGNRNAGLTNYESAIRFIVGMGGRVVKMGSVNTPFPPDIPGLIDYPHSRHRSEAMDIALIRRARYFIGTTSGLANVAIYLGIPTAQVNCLTTEYQPWTSIVRFCPKPIRRRNGSMLSQRELTGDDRWALATSQTMSNRGFYAEENTPDEILETVREVHELTFGNTSPPAAIMEIWRRQLTVPHAYGNALPSSHFLHKHEATFLIGADERFPHNRSNQQS